MTKKIKLLHITTSLKRGGAEAVLCDLVHSLDSELFEQHIVYFYSGPHVECLKKRGTILYHIQGIYFLYDPVFLIRFIYQVVKIKPDVIHTLLWSANVLGRVVGSFLGIPVVSALHNNVEQDGIFRFWGDWLTLNKADRIIAVSQEVATSLQKREPWLPAQKIEIITNGVDSNALQAKSKKHAVQRAHFGLTDKHFVIGSVGRFEPVKNYSLLIESFALLYATHHHARLVLVGYGSQEGALRKQVHHLGIDAAVIFVVGREAIGYYALFDCFVLSSDQEGISIALLEAMSCGVACVSTHIGYDHSVIKHGINGLLVPAGNKAALNTAFDMLICDQNMREQLGKSGLKTVKDHMSSVVMSQCYEQIFKNVVK